MFPLLFLLAIGPSYLLLHAIYVLDRWEREPILHLVRYLLVGLLSVFAALLMESASSAVWDLDLFQHPLAHPITFPLAAFLGIGLLEELSKLLPLWFFARRDRELDEPFDWVVYAVTVSLGFATIENLCYVLDPEAGGVATGLFRAMLAVPGHALFGTLMGSRLARAACLTGPAAKRERAWALFEPALWHGAYDALALVAASRSQAPEGDLVRTGAVFGFLVLVAALWWTAAQRVREARQLSNTARRTPPLFVPYDFLRPPARGTPPPPPTSIT